MSSIQQLLLLNEKMKNLLESAAAGGNRFSALDKEMLAGYVKEMYELTLAIHAEKPLVPVEKIPEKTVPPDSVPPAKPLPETQPESAAPPTGGGVKKTLSERYSTRHDTGTVNDRFRKQGHEIADKLKLTPIHDLRKYIGLNKRMAFISSLFSENTRLFDETLARLDGCSSLEEATAYLQSEITTINRWEDHPQQAGDFMTLVKRRFPA